MRFDAIYADTCNTFFDNVEGISRIFQNKMLKMGAILMVTFVMRNDSGFTTDAEYGPVDPLHVWQQRGIPEFKGDTHVIKRTNAHIYDIAKHTGYTINRLSNGETAYYRKGVYCLWYEILLIAQ